jgi:hypothetical protein
VVQARRKPETVQAVQWRPGVRVEGLTEIGTEIRYSENQKLYYVSRPGDRSYYWLSVEAKDGAPSEDDIRSTAGLFGPTIAQFTRPDGRKHWRKSFSFATHSVRRGPVVSLDENTLVDGEPLSEMFRDYGSLARWPETSTRIALFGYGTAESQRVTVGDWIVTDASERRTVMSDAEFRAAFDVEVEN